MSWVRAIILAALAVPAAADSGLWSAADIRFFQQDIYAPFFRAEKTADGRVEMVTARERAHAQRFPLEKPPGALRIFVVGGSVAHRYTEEDRPRAGALRRGWSELLSGRPVELISMAVPSYDSARELLVVREALRYRPDVILLFSGHNEPSDPAWEPTPSNRLRWRLAGWGWLSRLARLLPRRRDAGVMLSRAEIAARFERNVAAMAALARAQGALLVLCEMPRNYADFPPGRALPLADADFFRAWRSLELGRAAEAAGLFEAYARAHPEDPFGYYAWAAGLRRLGRLAEARARYWDAVERSPNGGVTPARNAQLRAVGLRENAPLVDLPAAFDELAAPGLADGRLFDDHIHWNRSLNPAVTVAIARALLEHGRAHPDAPTARLPWNAAAVSSGWARALRQARAVDPDAARSALLNAVWFWPVDAQRVDEPSVASFDLVYRLKPSLLDGLPTEAGREEIRKQLSANVWAGSKLDRLTELWPQALDDLGEMYRRRGLAQKAVAGFDASLALAGDRPLTLLRRSMAQRALGRSAAADADYRKAALGAQRYPEIALYGELVLGKPRSAAGRAGAESGVGPDARDTPDQ